MSYEEYKESLVKKMVERDPGQATGMALETNAQKEERMRQVVSEKLAIVEEGFYKGVSTLVKTLLLLNEKSPELVGDAIVDELGKFRKKPEITDSLVSGFSTLQDAYGFSDETLEGFSRAVDYLVKEGRMDEACQVLYLLVGLVPDSIEAWLLLGNLNYGLKRYEEALIAYSQVMLYDPNDLLPYFYSIHCYLQMDDKEKAKNMVEACLALMQEDPEANSRWRSPLEELKSALS